MPDRPCPRRSSPPSWSGLAVWAACFIPIGIVGLAGSYLRDLKPDCRRNPNPEA